MLKYGLLSGLFLAVSGIALLVPWTDPRTEAEEIAFAVACACANELLAGKNPDEAVDAVYQGSVTKRFRKANGKNIHVLMEPVDYDAEDPKLAVTTYLTYEADQSLIEHLTGLEPPLEVAIATINESDPDTCRQQKTP